MQPKPQTAAKPSTEINIAQEALRFLRMLRHRWKLIALALVIAASLGSLYYTTTQRIYQSRATLLVQQNQPENWTKQAGDVFVKDLMETYRNMLTSDAVLNAAIQTLPEQGRVDLAEYPSDTWQVALRKNLQVTLIRKTNILEISYYSKSPTAAAAVVDNVVSAYLKFMDKLHLSTAREMLDILTREKVNLEKGINTKETELLTLKQQIGDVILREGDSYVSMLAKALEGDFQLLRQARAAKLDAESQWKALETAIRNGDDLQQYTLALMPKDNQPGVQKRLGPDSAMLSRVCQQLLDDTAQLRIAQARYGPAHSKVRELTDKVRMAEELVRKVQLGVNAEMLGTTNEELATVLRRAARQQYQVAVEYEDLVAGSYELKKRMAMDVQNNLARLDVLNRDLDRMYNSLDVLTEQIKGIEIGKDNGMLGTVILSSPQVPTKPVKPSLMIVAFVSLVLGLGGGIAAAYLIDMLDDRFGSVDEMRLQLGDIPVLAMIRRLESLGESGIECVQTFARPNDVATEAFRTLRTALSLVSDGARTISVSSSEPGDGKTTVIANLAVAMAQSGKKTLLIDADIRRPRLTPLLNLRGYAGLTTILHQHGPVGDAVPDCLCAGLMPSLDVIPSGPRSANAAELLTGERLPDLLAWAESQYDYVFVDGPPAFVSDVAIIGRLADGVVLVIRPDKNRRRTVIRAVEGLTTLGVNLFGLVLNHFSSDEGKYGYNYEYRYDYNYGYGHDDSTPKQEAETIDADESVTQPVPIMRRSA